MAEAMEVSKCEVEPNDINLPSCVICGSQFLHSASVVKIEFDEDGNTVGEVDQPEGQGGGWTEDDLLIFQWFCSNLGVTLSVTEWNASTEPIPFCGGCKSQLASLVEIKKKLEELEESLRNGVELLKEMVRSSEGVVQNSGIYERDGRLFDVRHQIIEGGALKNVKHPRKRNSKPKVVATKKPELEPLPSVQLSKRSGRLIKPVDRYRTSDQSYNTPDFLLSSPIVLLSTQDKANAELRQKEDNVKKELDTTGIIVTAKKPRLKKKKEVDINVYPTSPDFVDESWSPFNEDVAETATTLSEDSFTPDTVTTTPTTSGRKPKQKLVKKEDEDFIPSEDSSGEEIEEDETFNSDLDYDDDNYYSASKKKGRKRKGERHHWIKKDPDSGDLLYRKFRFHPVADEKYSCSICDTIIENKGRRLQDHAIRVHTKLHVCSKCGRTFAKVNELSMHIKGVHAGINTARAKLCQICGKTCSNKTRYTYHIWTHKSEEEKQEAIARGETEPKKPNLPKESAADMKYQCEVCGKQFPKKNNYDRHKMVHADKSQLPKELCPTCGKWVFSHYMREHNKMYHSEGRYPCGKCTKIFTTGQKLGRHQRVHQHYICPIEICGKSFASIQSFTGHMNLHNNIRPFKCDHCEMSFASQVIKWKHNKKFHVEGAAPRRKAYIRGLKITLPPGTQIEKRE